MNSNSAKEVDYVPLAHVGAGGTHALHEHLHEVARRAGEAGASFGALKWTRLAGLWHDLGKYRAGFQKYIRQSNDPDAHIEGRIVGRDKTHSAAGALWSHGYLKELAGNQGVVIGRILSYLIAGHHAGLDDWHGGLKERLVLADSKREFQDALSGSPPDEILRPNWVLPDLSSIPADGRNGNPPGSFALWVRMLFSCLVDADFLDTEQFFDQSKSKDRADHSNLLDLSTRFDVYMANKLSTVRDRGEHETPVNLLRADVLRQCRAKAQLPPGAFTLTVPTGGGKTLSSTAFALTHAVKYGKRRIVYTIPYTSIIEQTAGIFREIFGDENVVEHHSNVESDERSETHRSRLACENWDAPIIVTTNVQLFESLFARKTSRCRKLHSLVDSVIVLDEAQLLPVEYLQPILDVLRILTRQFGVTLIFCTATQPALTSSSSFDARRGLRGFAEREVDEIIQDVPALYRGLRRVEVHRPHKLDVKREWPAIAAEIAEHEAVLAIVNRRADAHELYRLLKAEHAQGLWHLSALMCPQHRSDVILKIKSALVARREALRRGEAPVPVRVVSTQLVEAGVDLDFPVVFRAMAGLDSIAQAAGRCNREGLLPKGEVHVFVPPTLPPPGLLRQAESKCRSVWHDWVEDPLDLRLFPRYFAKLYSDANLDNRGICEMLRVGRDADVRFRQAAEAFRLIDNEDSATVIVRYRTQGKDGIDQWIAMLERDGPQRWLMRKLQRFGVTIYKNNIQRLVGGDIREFGICPGLYVQVSDTFYDPVTGANVDGAPGDPAAYYVA